VSNDVREITQGTHGLADDVVRTILTFLSNHLWILVVAILGLTASVLLVAWRNVRKEERDREDRDKKR